MPDNIKILTPYEIAKLSSVPATEPEPAKQDNEEGSEQEIILDLNNYEHPKLYTRGDNCIDASITAEKELYKIRFRCTEQSSKNKLGKTYDRISKEELKRITANVQLKSAFRPNWRDLNYSPELIPHRNEKLIKNLPCTTNVPVSILLRMELTNYTACFTLVYSRQNICWRRDKFTITPMGREVAYWLDQI